MGEGAGTWGTGALSARPEPGGRKDILAGRADPARRSAGSLFQILVGDGAVFLFEVADAVFDQLHDLTTHRASFIIRDVDQFPMQFTIDHDSEMFIFLFHGITIQIFLDL
jgi:hypothetical protein